MAPKDGEYSLRELIRSQNEMLLKHMKDSNDSNTAILIKLNTLETHQSYTKEFFADGDKKFKDIDTKISKLQTSDKNQKLTSGLISAATGAITGFIHTLFGGH